MGPTSKAIGQIKPKTQEILQKLSFPNLKENNPNLENPQNQNLRISKKSERNYLRIDQEDECK